tara:strand:- start:9908 stop:10108 length:201 start_codon:yes stop_codon:yes gene_type:complete
MKGKHKSIKVYIDGSSFKYNDNFLDDINYINDKKKLFKENGNGWWWYQNTNSFQNQNPYSNLRSNK